MAEHKHGEMDITVQKKTFDGFINAVKWSVIAIIATLIFIALVLFFVLPGMIGWPFAVPQFGFDLGKFEHLRIAGPICAVWLALFSIPFFRNARDPGRPGDRRRGRAPRASRSPHARPARRSRARRAPRRPP